jgi:CRP/FNR family transcriptional regulator, dissimilatory nitrate respiration regulator
VFSGMIKLYRLSLDGHEKIFELESDGDIFAEALMFNEQTSYPVSASALQISILIEINSYKFRQILSKSFETSMMIMTDLSKRLHTLINEIDNLSLMTVRNRISTYFLEQALPDTL